MHRSFDEGRAEFRPASPAKRGPAPAVAPRGDSSIRAEILDVIARAPWLDLGRVAVGVERGEVLFEGEIPERRLRIALHDIAARCRGVRAVHDRLRVARRGTL